VILEPTYTKILSFNNGHAKATDGSSWGIINNKGKEVVPIEYDEISDFSSIAIWAKKGESFGLVTNGTFTPIAGIDKIWDFHPGSNLTYARNSTKLIGFINTKGEWVIEPQFDKARAFFNGLAPVVKDKKWGYVNEKGEVVIDFQFKDAEIFSKDGLAPVKDKKWGFVDTNGKVVIPTQYDINSGFGGIKAMFTGESEFGFRNGLARVKFNKKWGFLDTKGDLLGNKWFENAELFTNND
ncbi:MAG: WG repeat-containing protein, partial [Mangrovimonas sp.]|nr:WG repeat-containing protein [Mangrovimonas sp.]